MANGALLRLRERGQSLPHLGCRNYGRTVAAAALAGISVVDLSDTLAGALATQLLADFGADVVLVEPPRGATMRGQPAWPAWGRGKRSAVLDLKQPGDLAAARRLAAHADVVVETWRPGVAERLGLGFADLEATNPRLIYGSVTAFGRDGPYAQLPGYEGVVMAKVGAFDASRGLTTRPGPAFVSAPYCSFSASQLLLHGVLAALFERETGGRGQRVDVTFLHSLGVYDCWNWLLRLLAARYPEAFLAAPPVSHDEGVPNSSMLFRLLVGLSADGRWMQFSQITDKLWEAFLHAAGLADLLVDPAWRGVIEEWDTVKRGEFWDRLLEAVRARTYAEWCALFDGEPDVWAEVFRHGTELLHHPQLEHDHQTLVLHDRELGAVHQPGPLVRMTATPARVVRDAPRPGEHTAEVRADERRAPAAATATPRRDPPLAGVTVLELATFYAAPYGATLLCDLGARVIKAEPLGGDPVRNILPFPELGGIKVLQGKESIAVDVTTDAGRDIVVELARRSDAVLQSFRAGVAERLGLDARSLLAQNPDLIYLNAPGYGTGGPCGRRPAFAPTIGAASGLAMRNIGPTVPSGPDLDLAAVRRHSMRLSGAAMGFANADGCSALGVATALLLGLVARRRGAPGQELTTTMLSTLAHTLSEDMVEYAGRVAAPAPDADLYGINARYRLYETSDGWVFLAAPGQREWDVLTRELAPWADFEPDAPDAVLTAALAAAFRRRTATEWEAHLVDAGVACVAVGTGAVEDHLMGEDGIGRRSGIVTEVEHPLIGTHTRLAPPVRFSMSSTVAGAACLVGHHTDAIMEEIGYRSAQIAELRAAKVIG
jgi:crotonobetainyl-CoA:carnitine CoA-transferase CaiB-like acyl-CoA transferase